jgi:hypothetical protein
VFEFLYVVHLSSRSIYYTISVTPQEEIKRCEIKGPKQAWDQSFLSNLPTTEPLIECVTNDVPVMWGAIMLNNFISALFQQLEGVGLKHVKVGGDINSSLSERQGSDNFVMEQATPDRHAG